MPRAKQFEEQEVLEKAMHLFWKSGYHATTIQQLVNQLGINRASMYQTFGGKDELFQRALQRYTDQRAQQIQEVFDKETSVVAGFRRLFGDMANQLATDQGQRGCFVVNTATELLPDHEGIKEFMRYIQECEVDLYREQIERGIRNGEIEPSKDSSGLATYLLTMHGGMKVIAKVDRDLTALMGVVDQTMKIFD